VGAHIAIKETSMLYDALAEILSMIPRIGGWG